MDTSDYLTSLDERLTSLRHKGHNLRFHDKQVSSGDRFELLRTAAVTYRALELELAEYTEHKDKIKAARKNLRNNFSRLLKYQPSDLESLARSLSVSLVETFVNRPICLNSFEIEYAALRTRVKDCSNLEGYCNLSVDAQDFFNRFKSWANGRSVEKREFKKIRQLNKRLVNELLPLVRTGAQFGHYSNPSWTFSVVPHEQGLDRLDKKGLITELVKQELGFLVDSSNPAYPSWDIFLDSKREEWVGYAPICVTPITLITKSGDFPCYIPHIKLGNFEDWFEKANDYQKVYRMSLVDFLCSEEFKTKTKIRMLALTGFKKKLTKSEMSKLNLTYFASTNNPKKKLINPLGLNLQLPGKPIDMAAHRQNYLMQQQNITGFASRQLYRQ